MQKAAEFCQSLNAVCRTGIEKPGDVVLAGPALPASWPGKSLPRTKNLNHAIANATATGEFDTATERQLRNAAPCDEGPRACDS
jgi:hypothetical protein